MARCIQGLRIAKAKNLILTTSMSIREIALSVGFSSDIAFFKAFKKVEMVTPSTMRKNRGRYGSGGMRLFQSLAPLSMEFLHLLQKTWSR